MLVAAVTATAVLAIFQIARYETLETVSRGNTAKARWLAHGAKELAVAKLMADPSFRGEFRWEATPGSGDWGSVQVTGDDRLMTIIAIGSVQGMQHTISSSFTGQQLNDRLADASHASQTPMTETISPEVPQL